MTTPILRAAQLVKRINTRMSVLLATAPVIRKGPQYATQHFHFSSEGRTYCVLAETVGTGSNQTVGYTLMAGKDTDTFEIAGNEDDFRITVNGEILWGRSKPLPDDGTAAKIMKALGTFSRDLDTRVPPAPPKDVEADAQASAIAGLERIAA
jgi:hypothetical protein